MNLSEFDFDLPKELIAYHPKERGCSRMLDASNINIVGSGRSVSYIDRSFLDIPQLFNSGDVIVLNETKVLQSELRGFVGASTIKINLMEELESGPNYSIWSVFAKPGKRLELGTLIQFEGSILTAEVVRKIPDSGEVHLKFQGVTSLIQELEHIGNMPLPPYIKRNSDESDKVAYQTVFAKKLGSVAAPTAGLHFTADILDQLINKGVKIAKVTLHVGRGTFEPVKVSNINDHKMHKEWFSVDATNAKIINDAANNPTAKVICVGTTTMRTLESIANMTENGRMKAMESSTSIFIKPGYRFKIVDMLLTNFHLPKSTLFMLICAILGVDEARNLYKYAINQKYRFFSYGDCCLLRCINTP